MQNTKLFIMSFLLIDTDAQRSQLRIANFIAVSASSTTKLCWERIPSIWKVGELPKVE